MGDRVTAFSNGSQYLDWQCANCEVCRRFNNDADDFGCDIAEALGVACILDGTVEAEIARRANVTLYGAAGHYNWPCGELEPNSDDVQEAVDEFHGKHRERAARLQPEGTDG